MITLKLRTLAMTVIQFLMAIHTTLFLWFFLRLGRAGILLAALLEALAALLVWWVLLVIGRAG